MITLCTVWYALPPADYILLYRGGMVGKGEWLVGRGDGRGGGGTAVAGRRRAADAGTFVAHSGQSNDGLALAYHHLVGLSGIHEFRVKFSAFFAAYAVGQALGRVVPLDDVLERN